MSPVNTRSAISDIEDLPPTTCPYRRGDRTCAEKLPFDLTRYINALQDKDAYTKIKEVQPPNCVAMNDHFKSEVGCVFRERIQLAGRGIIRSRATAQNFKVYDEFSNIYLSALLREPSTFQLRDETHAPEKTDLAGDGGKLTYNAVYDFLKHDVSDIKFVVDIGGQDTSFVSRFPNAKKLIIDQNILTLFLQSDSSVNYIIGDANAILQSNGSMERPPEGKAIFAMNHLINVLSPAAACSMIESTSRHMSPNDLLIITNLREDQLIWKPSESYKVNHKISGIRQFDKFSRETKEFEPYKSTIGPSFLANQHFFTSCRLSLVKTITQSSDCMLNTIKSISINYITIILQKTER